ncbi:MAG: histone deacetylase, partial [Verrucomicrobia bacterium]|nr:histone deacetylase [Verrucomicrobiota bacterium]
MICLMNDESMIVYYDERCADYASPGHPERPDRVTMTAKRLKKQSSLSVEWRLPVAASEEAIRLAHSAVHFENLRE